MTALTVAAADVKPLPGSIVINMESGAVTDLGEAVFTAADGQAELADADAAASAQAIGVCVSAPRGALLSAVGDRIDVQVFGPLAGFSGLTPGDLIYVSATAGGLDDAAPASGDYIWVLGWVLSATTIFINPWTYDIVVTS